jgi:hypothetical protein
VALLEQQAMPLQNKVWEHNQASGATRRGWNRVSWRADA